MASRYSSGPFKAIRASFQGLFLCFAPGSVDLLLSRILGPPVAAGGPERQEQKRVRIAASMAISIEQWVSALRSHGAKEVDQYKRKLRSFGAHEQKIFEMLSEARAALLFLRTGWQVTMRD